MLGFVCEITKDGKHICSFPKGFCPVSGEKSVIELISERTGIPKTDIVLSRVNSFGIFTVYEEYFEAHKKTVAVFQKQEEPSGSERRILIIFTDE